jgi:DNA primase
MIDDGYKDVTAKLQKVWETAEGFRTFCPNCDDTQGKLYFNTAKGVGVCFHQGCSWSPDRHGVTSRVLRDALRMKSESPTVIVEQAEMSEVKLPKEFHPISEFKDPLRENLYSYLESRGLVRKLIDRMKVGYCKKGHHWGYLVFPVFNSDGETVYWQGRRFKKREPKFYNPKASYKTELLYVVGRIFWRAAKNRRLVLVESIINALTIGWPSARNLVVALLGSSMSDSQLYQILSFGIKDIVVALDGDMWKQSVAIADRLLGENRHIRIAQFPYDRDINKLGREKSWSVIDSAELYLGGRMSASLSRADAIPWERQGKMAYDPTIL